MKKNICLTMALMLAMALSACGSHKKTSNGLKYDLLVKGEGRAAQMGDIVKGMMALSSQDSIIFALDKSEFLMQIQEPIFPGDLNEGLLMLHEGDSAVFYIPADSMAKYMGGVPDMFGKYVIYSIKVDKFYTEEELQQENLIKAAEAKEIEKEAIAKYLADNNLNIEPTESGLYFIETQKGKGKPAEEGKIVKVNYVGKRLDGKLFDTNIEQVAKDNNMYMPQRTYEPMEVPAGMGQMIPGFDEALTMMPKGSKAIVIIPFELAYGEYAVSEDIPAYTTLVFEVEMVDIQ
ncbi:MAG: FKBP-type peptidyl-prolyl cis-trans isomerase [Lentimicrobiaceae bacterium]|nr:FKBP-type peptidyl-prolyl cis-trans isomerase [Lentimicrobiaceae bacterium]